MHLAGVDKWYLLKKHEYRANSTKDFRTSITQPSETTGAGQVKMRIQKMAELI